MAIRKIRHKGLKKLFEDGTTAKIGTRYHEAAILIMDHLDAAVSLKDCEGVKDFHPLKGDRKRQYSMHVNGNMCIVFTFADEQFEILDFEDYHR